MKKKIALMIITSLSLSMFTACGGDSDDTATTEETVVTEEVVEEDTVEEVAPVHQEYKMVNFSESLAKHPELRDFLYSLCDGDNETDELNRWTIGFTDIDDKNELEFMTGDTESFEAMYSFSYDFAEDLTEEHQEELANILASYYDDVEVTDFQNEYGEYDAEKLSNVAIWVAADFLDDTTYSKLNYSDGLTREQLIKLVANFYLTSYFINGNVEQASDVMKGNLGDSDIIDDENYYYVALTALDGGNFFVEANSGLTNESLHENAKNAELVYVYNLFSGQSQNLDVDVSYIGMGDLDSTITTLIMNYIPYQEMTGLSINENFTSETNLDKLNEAVASPVDGMPEEIYDAYTSIFIGYYVTQSGIAETVATTPWYEDLTKESFMNLLYEMEKGSQSYMNLSEMVSDLIYGSGSSSGSSSSLSSSSSSDPMTDFAMDAIQEIIEQNQNDHTDEAPEDTATPEMTKEEAQQYIREHGSLGTWE